MTAIRHKLRSAAFYLARPSFWSHFWHRGLGYLQPDLDGPQQRQEAASWAQRQAEPFDKLLARLGVTAAPDAPISRMPAAILESAHRRVSGAACRMGGAGHVDLIYAVTRLTRARNLLETGVAYGWSSLAFLTAAEENGDGRLVSVDRPYPGAGSADFVGIAVSAPLRRRWHIIREPDRNGLRKAAALFPDGVDIAHYDSDKTYRGRRFGYGMIWKALRPGGLFLSDDIQDNPAFAHFVEAAVASFGVKAFAGKFVGIAVKQRPPQAQGPGMPRRPLISSA